VVETCQVSAAPERNRIVFAKAGIFGQDCLFEAFYLLHSAVPLSVLFCLSWLSMTKPAEVLQRPFSDQSCVDKTL
jgi:hypothetical protein